MRLTQIIVCVNKSDAGNRFSGEPGIKVTNSSESVWVHPAGDRALRGGPHRSCASGALQVPDGFADPNVYVLDPCCGTGAFLVEVLLHIEKTLKSTDSLLSATNSFRRDS